MNGREGKIKSQGSCMADWGWLKATGAVSHRARLVLKSVARLMGAGEGLAWREELRVVVDRRGDAPRTVHQPDEMGRRHVVLCAEDGHWAQWVFQWSHELVHVVAYAGEDAPPSPAAWSVSPWLWMEECLAAVAERAVLAVLAGSGPHSWREAPPRAGWETFDVALAAYLGRLMTTSSSYIHAFSLPVRNAASRDDMALLRGDTDASPAAPRARQEALARLLPVIVRCNVARMAAEPYARRSIATRRLVAIALADDVAASPAAMQAFWRLAAAVRDAACEPQDIRAYLVRWRARLADDQAAVLLLARLAAVLGHPLP